MTRSYGGESSTCLTLYEHDGAPAVFESQECLQWRHSDGYTSCFRSMSSCETAVLEDRTRPLEDHILCAIDFSIPFPAPATEPQSCQKLTQIPKLPRLDSPTLHCLKMVQEGCGGGHAEAESCGGHSVVVGVKVDSKSRELLTWALVKVAQLGDRVIALHVIGKNEIVDRDGKSSLLSLVKAFDSVLAVYNGFCNLKQVTVVELRRLELELLLFLMVIMVVKLVIWLPSCYLSISLCICIFLSVCYVGECCLKNSKIA